MPANEDLCDSCGYHRILQKKIDLDGVYRPPAERGATAWLTESLQEGESIGSVAVWAAVCGGAVLLFIGVLFHPWSWCIVIPFAIAVGFYVANRIKKKSMSGDAYAPGAVERQLWQMVLLVVRISGYRAPRWPFPKLKSETGHARSFDDDQLAALPDLKELQALDLEGTSVTDAALDSLSDLRRLQYLVLKGTNVSPEAILSLQKSLRRTWIWH